MATAIAMVIRPAHPDNRLVAPSSASTKDSALRNASVETASTSASGVRLSACILPPIFIAATLNGFFDWAHSGGFCQVWQGPSGNRMRRDGGPFANACHVQNAVSTLVEFAALQDRMQVQPSIFQRVGLASGIRRGAAFFRIRG
ncbi:hypothetical protein ACSVBT_18865 [Afipia sp. TerB]